MSRRRCTQIRTRQSVAHRVGAAPRKLRVRPSDLSVASPISAEVNLSFVTSRSTGDARLSYWVFGGKWPFSRGPAITTDPSPMLYRMVIWRLRHFANECRCAKQFAVDPMTRKELEQFEILFQKSALNIETTRDIEMGGRAAEAREQNFPCGSAKTETRQ